MLAAANVDGAANVMMNINVDKLSHSVRDAPVPASPHFTLQTEEHMHLIAGDSVDDFNAAITAHHIILSTLPSEVLQIMIRK